MDTLTITGQHFATEAESNEVSLAIEGNSAADIECNITSFTSTEIVCSVDAAGVVGNLVASVKAYGAVSNSATVAVLIATATIVEDTRPIAQSTRFLFISGAGFSEVADENTVMLHQGDSSSLLECDVVAAQTDSIVCSVNSTLAVGNLSAMVTAFGATSGIVQIGQVVEGPTCGLDARSVASAATTDVDVCPAYETSSCCDASAYEEVAAAIARAAQWMGPKESCCYERGASLLCGFSCDPAGSDFTEVAVAVAVAVHEEQDAASAAPSSSAASSSSESSFASAVHYNVYVCEDWCQESYEQCKLRPHSDGSSGTLEQYFAALNPSKPWQAFCESFNSSAASAASAASESSSASVHLQVKLGSHPVTGKCFAGSQCTAAIDASSAASSGASSSAADARSAAGSLSEDNEITESAAAAAAAGRQASRTARILVAVCGAVLMLAVVAAIFAF